MPYKRTGSSKWWISYVDATSGKQVRRSSGTNDFEAAKALESKLKSQAWESKEWGRQPDVSFEDVIVPYLEYAQSTLKSFKIIVHQVKSLRRYFAGKNMTHLRAIHINEYKEMRSSEGMTPATINRELSALSAAINHCKTELEWELPNPVTNRKMKEAESRIRWISKPQAAALMRAAESIENKEFGGLLRDFIQIALNTGCRKSELLCLEWDRVNFDQRIITLEGEHTKSGKRRSIPLNNSVISALKSRMAFRARFCPDSKWVFCGASGERRRCIRNGFSSACKKAGITDFRVHDMRHTCAAWLVSAGVPLSEVRDLLGHSSITMTEKYAHLAPARVAQAVALLDGSNAGSESQLSHSDHSDLNVIDFASGV